MSFRQVNKKTGNRLRQQVVDDETREPVEVADEGRGYEVAKNTFILCWSSPSTLAADFDPTQFVDRYEEAIVEMLKTKQAPMAAPKPREIHARNVINLMDALRRSIAGAGTAPPAKAAKMPPAALTPATPATPAAAATRTAAATPPTGASGAKGRKPKAPKPEDLRAAPQFTFPITGGKGKAKEEQVPAEASKSKSRRKSA